MRRKKGRGERYENLGYLLSCVQNVSDPTLNVVVEKRRRGRGGHRFETREVKHLWLLSPNEIVVRAVVTQRYYY